MNGKGDKPRNCFSKQFKDNYEQINWGKVSQDKVDRYPEHLKELIEALLDTKVVSSSRKNVNAWEVSINDTHKIKDFDIFPKNKKRDKLFLKYDLDDSVKDMYVWEVAEMMYNYMPF